MQDLHSVAANLERQRTVYDELEAVLGQQRAALVGRDIATLEAANGRQALLIDALGTLEAERRRLLGAVPSAPLHLSDLVGFAADPGLRERLVQLRDHLPAQVERVLRLTRTNRLLASDAGASTAHLLGLLGLGEPSGYAPPPGQATAGSPAGRGRRCHTLRLDVKA